MRLAETAAGEAIVGVRGTARSYLAKLNSDGSQDFTFGHEGLVRVDRLGSIAVDPATGEIAAAMGTTIRFLSSAGKPDASRGANGVVDVGRLLKLDPALDSIWGINFAPDRGLVFTATYPYGPPALGERAFLVGKLTVDGSFDGAFGKSGVSKLRPYDGFIHFQIAGDGSIFLLIDNEVVSALDGDVVTSLTPTLVRLTAKGKFDTSFAGDGILEVEPSNADRSISVGTALALDRDRAAIVATPQGVQPINVLLRRIRADGSVDPTFGAKGEFLTPGLGSLATAASGDILASGRVLEDENHFFGPATLEIRRLNANGKPVQSWADHGVARTDFSVLNATDIQVTPDGKPIIAAQMTRRGKQSFVVLRFDGPSENATPHSAFVLGNGTLDIAGSSKSDDIRVAMRNDQIEVRIGASQFTFDPASVSGIHIHSGGGADRIRLGDGLKNVYVESGKGDDIVQGGSGDENISGGEGNDWINGGAGNDSIRGYAGRDTLEGGVGNDLLIGGPGNDRLLGGPGDDAVKGSGGNDVLIGGAGSDRMYGEAGNDLLLAGDNERDALDGGSGFDTAQRDQSNRAVDLVLNIESFV
jgi:uncharacterized delta-60 repeat protein